MVYGHLACFQFATIKKKAIGFQNFRQRAVLPPPTLQPKAEEATRDAHISLAITVLSVSPIPALPKG